MARMKRKQIYIEVEQNRRLRAMARRRGNTESELIREGIDQVLTAPSVRTRDPKAWKKELAFMDRLAKMGPVEGKRTWARDDLYDDRLSRRH